MKWVWFLGGFLLGVGLFFYAVFGSGEKAIVRGLAIAGPLCLAVSVAAFSLDRSARRKRARERITWHRGYAFPILGAIGSVTAGFAVFVTFLVLAGILTLIT